MSLLALHEHLGDWNLVDLFIFIVIVAACAGIVYIVLPVFKVQIPPWIVAIFWVVIAAILAIAAIRFVASQ